MKRTSDLGRQATEPTAVSFLAEELKRLAAESASYEDNPDVFTPDEASVRSDLAQALDATWERSEAVYRSLADAPR